MTAHTPGPWLIRKGDEWTNSIVTDEGENTEGEPMFWEVASFNLRRDEAHANARLISAAPDLLDSLCALVLNHDAGGITLGALADARAAIAKATSPIDAGDAR